MSILAMHVILLCTWIILTGQLTWTNLVVGYIITVVVVSFYKRARGKRFPLNRVFPALKLVGFLFWEQIRTNIEMVKIVLSPRLNITPDIVKVDVDQLTEGEVTAVSHMITLTPGTLLVDIGNDLQSLYIHVVHLDDPSNPQDLIDSILVLERLVKGVSRG